MHWQWDGVKDFPSTENIREAGRFAVLNKILLLQENESVHHFCPTARSWLYTNMSCDYVRCLLSK
jgi:hypothetical protein